MATESFTILYNARQNIYNNLKKKKMQIQMETE